MKTPVLNEMYWLVKREFWEHRGGFLWAPVITGGIFLLLNLMGIVTGEVLRVRHGITWEPSNNLNLFNRALAQGDMAKIGAGLDMMTFSTTALISIVMGFVVFFYCLGALYDDRNDRSILFWKSLPVSDTATVLSKLAAATVLAPAIAVVCGVVTGLLMLVMYAITLSLHGVGVWHLLTLAHPFRITGALIGTIPLYFLWSLPTMGWLLLCSAWSRSKPIRWAVALPVVIGVVLGWFHLLGSANASDWYWEHIVGRFLLSAFPGGWLGYMNLDNLGGGMAHAMDLIYLDNAYSALAAPSLWIDAGAGAVMILGAIWLRRWRDDT